MPTEEKAVRDWNKIVSESKGQLMFLPSELEQAAKEWLAAREEYNSVVKEMAKKELSINMALQNILFEFRKNLDKNGHQDVWLKDIGFESNALDEGKFVVSIIDATKSRIPGA